MDSKEKICSKCNEPWDEERTSCSKCGFLVPAIKLNFEECIGVTDGTFDVMASDLNGRTVAERAHRESGSTSSSIATDLGEPSIIHSKRTKREPGFSEEGVAATALAKAFNSKHGTQYRVEDKLEEDSDYQDRVLVSPVDKPTQIFVQVRHFDDELIASLGRIGEFQGIRNSADFAERIDRSIEKKSMVDPALKSRTTLLLQSPAPIGKMVRREIQRMTFDLRGFRGVWISALGEECFELFAPTKVGDIAEAAYYRWLKEGPYWGDDQRHWYNAIDELRGIQGA